MIYLLLIFSVNISIIDSKDVKKYSPKERREITIELLREKNFERALSFAPDQNLIGCIKILKGDIYDGIEHIKESAAKGDIFSCDLFILFNLEIKEEDFKKYIEKKLDIYRDSTFVFESQYLQYLTLSPEASYSNKTLTDPFIEPFFLFKSGMFASEKNPEKEKLNLAELVNGYPESVPATVARNILRTIEEKTR